MSLCSEQLMTRGMRRTVVDRLVILDLVPTNGWVSGRVLAAEASRRGWTPQRWWTAMAGLLRRQVLIRRQIPGVTRASGGPAWEYSVPVSFENH